MDAKEGFNVEEHKLSMIGFDLCIFINHDSLQIEFEISLLFLLFELLDDFIGLNEVQRNHCEETHGCFWLQPQNPL